MSNELDNNLEKEQQALDALVSKGVNAEFIEKVQNVIADKLVIEPSEAKLTASFKLDLDADSIDLVELIMEFEKEFEVQIPDEDAEKIETVQDAINFLHSYQEAQ